MFGFDRSTTGDPRYRPAVPIIEEQFLRLAIHTEQTTETGAQSSSSESLCGKVRTQKGGTEHMARYGKTASKKVKKAMHERKKGTLRSGRSGKKVTSRKQAIAIGLSEARRAGGKVPRKKSKKK
jgi:hypothetical protein